MKFRVILPALTLIVLFAGMVWSADVSGKWIAQVPGSAGQMSRSTLSFSVDGDRLTGTVLTGQDEDAISDGRIIGDDIFFVVTAATGGENWWMCPASPSADGFRLVKMTYRGKVSGNEIKFTLTREGSTQVQEFAARRAK